MGAFDANVTGDAKACIGELPNGDVFCAYLRENDFALASKMLVEKVLSLFIGHFRGRQFSGRKLLTFVIEVDTCANDARYPKEYEGLNKAGVGVGNFSEASAALKGGKAACGTGEDGNRYAGDPAFAGHGFMGP